MFYVAGAKAKLALHLQTSGRRGLGMLCLDEGTDTHIVAHSISTLHSTPHSGDIAVIAAIYFIANSIGFEI